jgi:sensor histidine kinase YesM
LNIFTGSGQWKKIDQIYTAIFMVTLMMAVAVNFRVIMPRYLHHKRYGLFILFTGINILAFTFFNQVLFDRLIDYVLSGYYFISYYAYTDLLKFFFVFVTLTTLLHLSWEWYQLQETRHRMVVLEKEKIDAELKAFTNQVNPHFLFNSLTVLYSLALKNSGETSGAIIRLSDILRYVIYESSTGKVALRSEVALIHNYLALQRYRTDDSARIAFSVEIEDESVQIMPMLFLPLVENSFKHGIKGDVAGTFINIVLQSANGVVTFRIGNNKSDAASVEKPAGGIGLKNIRERLALVYPGRHSFEVSETEELFWVELKLNVGG